MGATPWRTGPARVHDESMWIFITLLWRITARLLRRLGWGTLLVPVAVLGVAVLGVTLWTVAAVALAVILAVRRPGTAAGLLPVTLVCAGIWGLALAAATPGIATWAMPLGEQVVALSVGPGGHGAVVKYSAVPVQVKAPDKAAVAWEVLPPAAAAVQKLPPPGAVYALSPPPGALSGPLHVWRADGLVTSLHQRVAKLPVASRWVKGGPPPGPAGPLGGTGPGTGLVPSWLLVPLALLMLTVGLWLMPRSLARLRERAGPLAPYLRQRLRETGWGLALVPVTLIGLSVFGVRPWTVAAVIAAPVITIWWPKVAADLVPFVLVVLALSGFKLAAHWAALPAGEGQAPWVPYGFVT